MQLASWSAVVRILVGLAVLALVGWALGLWMCRCYGRTPPLVNAPPVSSDRLRAHVEKLAGEIGPRSVFRPDKLRAAAEYIESVWRDQGYVVARYPYELNRATCYNLEVTCPGSVRPAEIVVVGAHYDTVDESPGANDNGSGVAALLELARAFAALKPERTVRFVAFPNEEPPWFTTPDQGSRVYARLARARGDDVRAMLALETMAYFRFSPGSQHYPAPFKWFYPNRGSFIGFIANLRSRGLLHRAVRAFRGTTSFPVECVATFERVPGVGWSDHASFWAEGYPALMVTDTAIYRYPYYHTSQDTPDRLDYPRLAEVTRGLCGAVLALAQAR